jgi:hypothetical protein
MADDAILYGFCVLRVVGRFHYVAGYFMLLSGPGGAAIADSRRFLIKRLVLGPFRG